MASTQMNKGAWQLNGTLVRLSKGAWQGWYDAPPVPPIPPLIGRKQAKRQYKIYHKHF